MVQISGNYELVENKNFYEFLSGLGLPEETAKERNEIKGTFEVTVDGDKIKMVYDTPQHVTNLVVGKEVEEQMGDVVFKSITKIDGNVITVTSTKDGSPSGFRTLTFSDSGLEVAMNAIKDGKTHSATRVYKRI